MQRPAAWPASHLTRRYPSPSMLVLMRLHQCWPEVLVMCHLSSWNTGWERLWHCRGVELDVEAKGDNLYIGAVPNQRPRIHIRRARSGAECIWTGQVRLAAKSKAHVQRDDHQIVQHTPQLLSRRFGAARSSRGTAPPAISEPLLMWTPSTPRDSGSMTCNCSLKQCHSCLQGGL